MDVLVWFTMGGALIFMSDNDLNLNDVQTYKTKFVVIGFSQVIGVDYMDIFSLVVQIDFIWIILSLIAQFIWKVHQLTMSRKHS